MTLTWKDLVATVLVALIGWIAYAQTMGISVPLLTNYRWATLAVGILAIGMCIFGSNIAPGTTLDGMQKLLAGLGILAFVAIVLSLIFGTKVLFLSMVTIIVVLWVLTTARHALA